MSLIILLVEPDQELRERVRERLRGDDHRVFAFANAKGAAEAIEEGRVRPSLSLLTAGEDAAMDRLIAALSAGNLQCQRVWIAPPGREEVDQLAVSRRPRGLLSRSGLDNEAAVLADRVWRTQERGRALVAAPPMLGESSAVLETLELLDRIAAGGAATVLITGESGTGKEVAARRLHALGPRGHGPFVEVDCASIPPNLIESELFGHEAGAFTDARQAKAGLLELAQGGTAFLDEIGELDLGLQAKLLRVLDSRRMRRLGGREEIPLDIHLIAATNRDLEHEVRGSNFRADLFYRLDVVRVRLTPVRERPGDAWLLAKNFLEEAVRRLGKGPLRLASQLSRELEAYTWPGNVREIRNHMERLALLSPAGCEEITDLALPSAGEARSGQFRIDFTRGPVAWETIEQTAIQEALRTAGGNVSEAARLLGLGRGALRYRMSRYGIDVPAEEVTPIKKAA